MKSENSISPEFKPQEVANFEAHRRFLISEIERRQKELEARQRPEMNQKEFAEKIGLLENKIQELKQILPQDTDRMMAIHNRQKEAAKKDLERILGKIDFGKFKEPDYAPPEELRKQAETLMQRVEEFKRFEGTDS